MRRVRGRPSVRTRNGSRCVWATLVLSVSLWGCQTEPVLTVPSATPFVLISIDTLRSDHLPAYGYHAVRTPAIDRLRASGILFEHAYSPAPLTLPAHATLLTGALPPRHGVRDNIGYSLDDSLPTLAEILRDRGYRTGAAVSAYVLRSETGIARGFDRFDDQLSWSGFAVMADVQRSGLEALEAIRGWLEGVADGPFFLFFHLYEPHAPYSPPEAFSQTHSLAYDGEIAAADHAVGELLAELDRLGAYERAVVVLTSDHGEGLGDHGEAEHGVLLYRESLQVPLILKLPFSRLGGESVETPVGLDDVSPTFLSLLGLPTPETVSGISLVDLVGRETPPRSIYSETYYPRFRLGWSALRSVVEDRYHYIAGPAPELFDLRADPGELRNLVHQQRRRTRSLADRLGQYDAEVAEPLEADSEARQALATLGYLGQRAGDAGDGPLPDPKARIHTLEQLDRGLASFREGDPATAIATLGGFAAENPRVVIAWEFLGRAYLHTGRHEDAYASLSRAFELSNGAPHLTEHLARAAVATGRLTEASVHLASALERAPESSTLRLIQGRVLLQQRRFAEALEVAEEMRRNRPDSADAVYLCGTVKIGLERLEEAEADLRHALVLSPRHAAAISDLAVLLLSRGEPAEARELLETLVRIQPENAHARRLLADLPEQAFRR